MIPISRSRMSPLFLPFLLYYLGVGGSNPSERATKSMV